MMKKLTFLIFLTMILNHNDVFAAKKRKYFYKRTSSSLFLRRDLKSVYVNATSLLLPSSLKKNSSTNAPAVQLSAFEDPREAKNNSGVSFKTVFGQLDWALISKKIYLQEGHYYVDQGAYKLKLTIRPKIQEAAQKFVNNTRIIDGSTVIIEPSTGRILAMVQSEKSKINDAAVTSRAPAASLMKIVTAAAAIEKQNLSPQDEIYFRGGCSDLRNENWIADPSRDRQKITFARAFGSSCNTVFGRLALYSVGLASLRNYAEKFMFNKPIPSDVKIQTSMFLLPDPQTSTSQEVAEAGAGFGATKLSAIHAAILSATVQNAGVMMAPYLVESAWDKNRIEVYTAKPIPIGRVVSKDTAVKIETLMQATVSNGTSRRIFFKKGTRGEIDEIGGKTGTLLDPENRDVLYTWFSGIAPLNSPNSIAIGTVVASQYNWVVRASSVAQTTLAEYLKLQKGFRYSVSSN